MIWKFETVTQAQGLTEGPVWTEAGLLFANIPNNLILRLDPATARVETHIADTRQSNGLMLDRQGRLYACEGGGRRIVRYTDAGRPETLCAHFQGARLNSPNDLAVDRQGRVWFTDPRYGDDRSDMELDHESVYRLEERAAGQWSCTRMTFDTTAPNGLLLAPDETVLYVAESKYGTGRKRELRAYPIREDGSLGEPDVLHNFYPHRGIDGMCLDQAGNIVATAGWELSGPGGMIYLFAPNGRVLATHPVPCQRPTNCAFGDADRATLYVTSTDGHLLRARTDRVGYWPYAA